MRDELLLIIQNLMEQQNLIMSNIDQYSDSELLQFQQDFMTTIEQVSQALDIIEAQEASAEALQGFIPQEAELLWILSGGNPDAFASYINTYPSNQLDRYKNSPEQIRLLAEQLQNRMPQNRQGEQDGIPQAWLQSSNIYGFNYDPKSKQLYVKFQGDGVYKYDNVPQSVYNVFSQGAVPAKTTGSNSFGSWFIGKIPSLGAAFHQLIKLGGYPYEKIS